MQADAEMVQAVLRGDRGAFATLVARHERAVWATAWRVLRDDHAAADAGRRCSSRRCTGSADSASRSGWGLATADREAVIQDQSIAAGSRAAFNAPR
jgi:hypothetical protein